MANYASNSQMSWAATSFEHLKLQASCSTLTPWYSGAYSRLPSSIAGSFHHFPSQAIHYQSSCLSNTYFASSGHSYLFDYQVWLIGACHPVGHASAYFLYSKTIQCHPYSNNLILSLASSAQTCYHVHSNPLVPFKTCQPTSQYILDPAAHYSVL